MDPSTMDQVLVNEPFIARSRCYASWPLFDDQSASSSFFFPRVLSPPPLSRHLNPYRSFSMHAFMSPGRFSGTRCPSTRCAPARARARAFTVPPGIPRSRPTNPSPASGKTNGDDPSCSSFHSDEWYRTTSPFRRSLKNHFPLATCQ